MFRVPVRLLEGRTELAKLRKELTAKYRDVAAGTTTDVHLYEEDANVFTMPRAFGRKRFPDLWARAINRTVRRPFKGRFPIRIKPRDAEQQKFVDGLVGLFTEPGDGVIDAQANAATGSGKTASACMMQARVGKRMLVIVHTNRLKEGWLGNEKEGKGLRFFYGPEWVDANVGIVQQDRCDYHGKAIVIAMAPSLCARAYPPEFYEQFEIVVVDELHKMATPVLNQVLGMFRARAHIGLTATPKEGDMAKAVTAHVGKPRIVSAQEVRKPKVCRLLFEEQFDFRHEPEEGQSEGDPIDNRNSLITFMARNRRRQSLISELVFYRGIVRGRNCLVLSDRTDQLLDIRRRLIDLGVDSNDIGMYVGRYRTGKTKLTGKISCGKHAVHFRSLAGFDNKKAAERYVQGQIRSLARSAGVHEASVSNGAKFSPETHQPSVEDYERIEQVCPVVLATYGIFDTGIDIKRLDWGLEASMRGDVAQAVGRILRIMAGKPVPEWYSIYDKLWTIVSKVVMGKIISGRYEHRTPKRLEKQRRASYAKQNAVQFEINNPYEALEKAKAAYAG